MKKPTITKILNTSDIDCLRIDEQNKGIHQRKFYNNNNGFLKTQRQYEGYAE